MQAIPTDIDGVIVFEPKVFGDARGFFLESFRQQAFDAAVGRHVEFVQDNHSRSPRGCCAACTGRKRRMPRASWCACRRGAVFDVAVDIRRGSPTFGRWFGTELSDANQRQLWIAPGLAHGFLVLSESADFLYKATAYYEPAAERSPAMGRRRAGDCVAGRRRPPAGLGQGRRRPHVRRVAKARPA